MPLFVVVGEDEAKIAPALSRVYPEDHIKVWTGFWFVSDNATAQKIGEKIGSADGTLGRIFIATFGGAYHGWGPKNVWEWIAVKGKG